MKKRVLSMIMAVLTVIALLPTPAAAANLPSISSSKYITTYTYKSSGTVNTYTDSSLKTKTGYITCATDDCRIYKISGNAVQVNYPTSSGRKTAWASRDAFTYRDLANEGAAATFTATKKITTYRWKENTTTFGYISKGDYCYLLRGSQNSDWLQVIYPTGSTYKMAWVKGDDLYATKITLDTSAFTLTSKGATKTIKATLSSSDSLDSVTWKSSNTSVATVTSAGVVKAVGNGTATITATTKRGLTATAKVTVNIPIVPTGVTLNSGNFTLTSAGATKQLTATVAPSNASNKSVTWTSSNTSVATVSSSGLVKAVGNGTSTITVKTSNGKTASVTVTVNTTVNPTGVTLSSGNFTLTSAGATKQLTVTVAPSNATDKSVTWTSSNTSVATVSSSGLVKAVGNGTSTITVKTSNGKTATLTVTVKIPVEPIDVILSSGSFTLTGIGTTKQLTATVTPSNADNKTVTWKSGNTNVVTVSSSGLVTAVGSGTATVTATTANNKTASVTVTVQVPESEVVNPTGVSLNSDNFTLTSAGATKQLTATIAPYNATDRNITWYSSNTAVAIVSSSGLVMAVGNGTATITATTSNGKTAAVTATVNIPVVPTGVTLNSGNFTLTSAGATKQLTATVVPSNATDKSVTWKSSNTSVATVSSSGLVKAVGNGTATITVTTSNGKTASVTVTVNTTVNPTGVTLNSGNFTLTSAGASKQLTATVAPSNATNKSVTWKSSNTSVVTVSSSGLVKAVGNGTATVTVTTSNGKTASVTVTVNTTVNPTGVTLNSGNFTLSGSGASKQLTATVAPSNATNKSVTWKSSNTSVATVSASGLVKAVGNGTATVTVTTSNGKTTTIKVTVKDVKNYIEFPNLTVSEFIKTYTYNSSGKVYAYTDSALTVPNGDSVNCATGEFQIIGIKGKAVKVIYPTSSGSKTAWFYRQDFTYQDLAKNGVAATLTASKKITTYRWKGKDTTYGYITKGDTFYLLRGGENSDWLQVLYPIKGGYKMGWVHGSDVYSKTTTTLGSPVPAGSYFNKKTDDNGWTGYHDINQNVTTSTPVYAIADGTIVCKQAYTTINGTKTLTSYGNFIQFTSSDGTYTAKYCHLSRFNGVTQKISSAQTKQQRGSTGTYTLATKTVKKGDIIGYIGKTGNASGVHLHFELYKNGKRIDPTSVISGLIKGETVKETGVSISGGNFTLNVGKSKQLTATVKPTNATNKKVTWTSSNTKVATVTSSGKVTAVGAGSAMITVKTNNGKTATVKVTVKNNTIFKQTDYANVSYGTDDRKNPATLKSGGCGVFAVVNAVYYLNGTKIDPVWLAKYALNTKNPKNKSQTLRYPGGTSDYLAYALCRDYGEKYGIRFVKDAAKPSDIISNLQAGQVAIVHVDGHFMALVSYDPVTKKYLVLDSYPTSGRGTSKNGFRWLTENEFKDRMKLIARDDNDKKPIHVIATR